jgi:hypothetical protein
VAITVAQECVTWGKEFCIHDITYKEASYASVCALPDGGFVVSWRSDSSDGVGIFARQFDANGQAVSNAFQANTTQNYQYWYTDVGALTDGGYVVCWIAQLCHSSADGVFARRYAAERSIYAKLFPEKPQQHQLKTFCLLTPAYDSTVFTTNPTISWQPASSMTIAYPYELEYSVQYDTLLDFSTASIVHAGPDVTTKLPFLRTGKTWFWKVLAQTYYGDSLWSDISAFFVSHTATDVQHDRAAIPESFDLSNYPNPFNPSTNILFELPQDGQCSLNIYDITGRLVRALVKGHKLAGIHAAQWNGMDNAGQKVAAGVYLYKIEFTTSNDETIVLTKKMSFVK